MSILSSLALMIARAVARLRRDGLDDELAEEIRLHLQMRREDLIARGMDARDADAAARRQFGNVTIIREESRRLWSFGPLDMLEQDIRYGVRLLRRAPWFTAVAVLSLAAGIGSAATIFNVADAVLLRRLPVRAADELHQFSATVSMGGDAKHVGGVDPNTFAHLQRTVDFAELIGFRPLEDVVAADFADGLSRTLRAESVTGNYFNSLGIRPAAGRLLGASDASAPPIPVVLSNRLWSAAYDGAPSILNRTLRLNGVDAVVVGIASAFQGVIADRPADIFVPLEAAPLLDPRATSAPVRVLTRLPPHITPAVAEERLAALYLTAGPSMVRAGQLRVRLTDASRGVADSRALLTQPLLVGAVLAGVLLLVSCANTGGLLLARSAARQTELGIRVALGASRERLVRQLATEAVLLSIVASAAALLIVRVAAPLLAALIPAGSGPAAFDLRFDVRLIVFTAGIAACAAMVAAGATLFRVMRREPAINLTSNTRTIVVGSRRTTRLLIAAQVASSLLLVIGAASMTRTLLNLRNVHPGFDPTAAFTVRVDATGLVAHASALPGYFRQLYERLAAAPAIARVSLAQFGPMAGGATTGTVEIAGFVPRDDDAQWVRMFWVGPDFFETLGMRLLRGRGIVQQDLDGADRVAVVNERFARFYFGSADQALGRVVDRDRRIVGVVADAHYDSPRVPPVRAMFLPFMQAPSRPAMTFIVRPAGDRTAAVAATVAAVRLHDRRLRPTVTAVSDQLDATLRREQFLTAIATVLSCLGVFLSCAALYAAVAYSTSRRQGEFAVRVALGATARDIVVLVLKEPVRVAITGVAAGLPGAYLVMRGASTLLYGIAPFDPLTVGISCFVLTAVATTAALWPALRASRIDPLSALRVQ